MKIQSSLLIKNIISTKSDYIGASASSLCLIHCMLTPVVFAVHASSLSCSEISPFWWKVIDHLFLVITAFAIYYTAKSTVIRWIPKLMWLSWAILTCVVINETVQFIGIPHALKFLPAIGLISFHMYNLKFCRCNNDQCCTGS